MSLEDLYKDLTIGNAGSAPLPTFSFPELPPALATDHDRENWKTLGDALNKSNDQVAILDDIVKELVSVNRRFDYIGESVKWLKLELERMCELPPLAANPGDEVSEWDETEEDYIPHRKETEDRPDQLLRTSDCVPDQQEESVPTDPFVVEGMFKPSEMYDWSEIENDILLLQEVIIMNPLIAIYEILEAKPISEADLDHLFAQSPLAEWDGTNENALLEVLKSLAQSYIEWPQPRSPGSPMVHESHVDATDAAIGAGLVHKYPSPKITDPHEVRILELLPGTEEDPIQCRLSIEHLQDDPRYKALSYAWGTATELKTIQLNEVSFEITPNLEVALRHLRDESEPQRLWIDALCINQNDSSEKQAQVKLMSEIYPAADQVLCWLGPEEDDSFFVMHQLQQVVDILSSSYQRNSITHGVSDLSSQSKPDHGDSARFDNGLYRLHSRAWWSRLWTCQEFALSSKDPLLMCGKQSIPWSQFCLVNLSQQLDGQFTESNMVEIEPNEFWEGAETAMRVHKAFNLRNELNPASIGRTSSHHPIYEMAIHTRGHRCVDDRDKLYGILSFLPKPHRVLLPPNYTLPVRSVYSRYSAAILMASRSGTIYDHLSAGSPCASHFPSWAFDFSSQVMDGKSHPAFLTIERLKPCCGSKGHKVQCVVIGPRLLIRGFVLDTIRTVKTVHNSEPHDPAQLYHVLSEFQTAAIAKGLDRVDSTNPIFRFEHLRTADSVYGTVTSGLYDHSTFQSESKHGNSSQDGESAKSDPTTTPENSSTDSNKIPSDSRAVRSKAISMRMVVVLYAIAGRKLFITESGFFGIGINEIQKGDLVVVFFGFDIPMVVRQHGNYFSLIGRARVGGIMQGQLMEFVDDGTLEARTFEIR